MAVSSDLVHKFMTLKNELINELHGLIEEKKDEQDDGDYEEDEGNEEDDFDGDENELNEVGKFFF